MTGKKTSPIVLAIADAEKRTSCEIRVHLSRRWLELDPMRSARKIFNKFGLHQTPQQNAVLLYVNLRRRKFAVMGDVGVHEIMGNEYWTDLARDLKTNFLSTHYENAISTAVQNLGLILSKHFPAKSDGKKVNELSDEVTQD